MREAGIREMGSQAFAGKWIVIATAIMGLVLMALLMLLRGYLPGGDGVIARAIAPDGTEMCIVQTFNDPVEPYTVSFYYRKPGKQWGWFYYDHEDTRWFSGTIELDDGGNLAHVKRNGKEVARFDVSTEGFTIISWNRTNGPTQTWMPKGWKPEDALSAARVKSKSPMSVGASSNSPPSSQWK